MFSQQQPLRKGNVGHGDCLLMLLGTMISHSQLDPRPVSHELSRHRILSDLG
jgi:hypothetical protein